MIILDTNIISEITKGRNTKLLSKFKKLDYRYVALCSIVVGEIQAGLIHLKLTNPDRYKQIKDNYSTIIDNVPCVEYSKESAIIAGQIKGSLKKKGTPVSDSDCMIGACAITVNATLITLNGKDFKKIASVSDLVFEDWS